MPLLSPGDSFPALSLTPPGSPALTLPDAFGGDFGVVLFFRGSWCPYCNAQLRAFQRASGTLAEAGIEVAALSVDDEPATAALIAKHGRPGRGQRVLQRRHRPARPGGRDRPGPLPARARDGLTMTSRKGDRGGNRLCR